MWDDKRELPQPWCAEFLSFTDAPSTADSAREITETRKESRQCQVCGCDNLLPETQKDGWAFTWVTSSTHSFGGLCKHHYARLSRAHTAARKARPARSRSPNALSTSLWTSEEVACDMRKQCRLGTSVDNSSRVTVRFSTQRQNRYDYSKSDATSNEWQLVQSPL